MNKGPLKAHRNRLLYRILKQKVCKFSTFFSGIESGFILSNVKCLIQSQINAVVFAHSNLDLNAFVVFVLTGIDVFLFLTEEFQLFICSLTRSWTKRVVLPIHCSVIAPATRELVHFFVGVIRCQRWRICLQQICAPWRTVWNRAFLRVQDLWAMRNGMVSFLQMLVIL